MAYSADTFTAGEVPTTAKWNKLWSNDADFDSRLLQAAPVGEVTAFAGSSAPTGWLLCDGSAVSRTTYADLFAIIGTVYGAGNGSTTFNLPNSKGRAIVARDSAQTEFDVVGETGGAKTHTLIIAEMPAHTHPVPNGVSGGTPLNPGNNIGVQYTDNDAGATALKINTSAGGGGAHNNLQPYLVMNHIIKT